MCKYDVLSPRIREAPDVTPGLLNPQWLPVLQVCLLPMPSFALLLSSDAVEQNHFPQLPIPSDPAQEEKCS